MNKGLAISFLVGLSASIPLSPSDALAGVNLKNGNFHMSYKDVSFGEHNSDSGLDITRTYNSRALGMGLFGYGWGSDFETYLLDYGGKVVIHENGTGMRKRFILLPEFAQKQPDTEKIIAVELRNAEFTGAHEMEARRSQMRDDEGLRSAYYRDYVGRNLFDFAEYEAKGSADYHHSRIRDNLRRTPIGYRRFETTRSSDGAIDYFDREGRFHSSKLEDGTVVFVVYDQNEELSKLIDDQGHRVDVLKTRDGRAMRLVASDNGAETGTTEYEYKKRGLARSRDISDNVYRYSYDDNYNITRIRYWDESERNITYHPGTQFVASIKELQGEVTRYVYGDFDDREYWTEVYRYSPEGERTRCRGYYYIMGVSSDGTYHPWSITIRDLSDGSIITNTIYNMQGRRIWDDIEGHVSTYSYDSRGREKGRVIEGVGYEAVMIGDEEYRPVEVRIENSKASDGRALYSWLDADKVRSIKLDNGASILLDWDQQLTALVSEGGRIELVWGEENSVWSRFTGIDGRLDDEGRKQMRFLIGHQVPSALRLPSGTEVRFTSTAKSPKLRASVVPAADSDAEAETAYLIEQLEALALAERGLLAFPTFECLVCYNPTEGVFPNALYPDGGPASDMLAALRAAVPNNDAKTPADSFSVSE